MSRQIWSLMKPQYTKYTKSAGLGWQSSCFSILSHHGGFVSFITLLTCSWIAFAPVAGITRDYFHLSSTTPVNWLSTVVLFVYCVISPITAYVYNHHGVRLGVNLIHYRLMIVDHRSCLDSDRCMVKVRGCKSRIDAIRSCDGWTNYQRSRTTVFSKCPYTL